jgi:hypothetical protein
MPMAFFFFVRPLYAETMLGLPFGVLALLGGLGIVVKRLYAVMPLTVGWWLLFALFYSGNTYQADRFVLSYLPPLAILAGFGFVFACQALTKLAERLPLKTAVPVVTGAVSALGVVAAVGLAIVLPAAVQDFRALASGKNDYLQASACVQRAAGSDGAVPVLTFGVTFTVQQYTGIPARDLYYETPQSVSTLPAPGGQKPVGYLLLPLNGFEAQWGSTPMGQTYEAIKSRYTLEPVSCPGTSFSLFALR